MRRLLFTLCSALSLLLGVAVCVLWARSYESSDQLVWRGEASERSVRSCKGRVVFGLNTGNRFYQGGGPPGLKYARGPAVSPEKEMIELLILCSPGGEKTVQWRRGDFAWIGRRNPRGHIARGAAPFWGLAAVAAVLPLGWTAGRVRSGIRARRRVGAGLCPACAYDLRATPRPGGALLDRCPECGTARGG